MGKKKPTLNVFPDLKSQLRNDLPVIDNYRDILTSNTPIIDLRSPCEFAEGAFPAAKNLPLMNDSDREQIGTCYKQEGQESAIKLGYQLVSGDIKNTRIDSWKDFIKNNQDAVMYCFRGGMRSQIAQIWLHEQGVDIKRIKGGYKALRRFLLDEIERLSEKQSFITLSGLTGIGKTHFINQYKKHIDLEGLANHKGSSFGHEMTPQPTPINFDNAIALDLINKENLPGIILAEDEGNRVGILSIPLPLVNKLKQSPIVLLKEPLEYRINVIYQDYIEGIKNNAIAMHGENEGQAYFSNYMLSALERIQKRLGNERYTSMSLLLKQAIDNHDKNKYYDWIEQLMTGYYDPMYQYQLSQKQDRVIFEGTRPEVTNYLQDKVF